MTTGLAAPVVRTGLQALIAQGIVRLVEVLPDPDLTIDANDRVLILTLLTAGVTLVQNVVERAVGHRFMGERRAWSGPLTNDEVP